MKRILSFILIVAMLLCAIPVMANASEANEQSAEATESANGLNDYRDLYVKDGLVALFTAYEAVASDTTLSAWAPADYYGKSGYDSYLDPAGYTASLVSASNMVWTYENGYLSSAFNGTRAKEPDAYMNLTPLMALMQEKGLGTVYSIQTVRQLVESNKIPVNHDITVDSEGRYVINNYTEVAALGVESGKETFGTLSLNWKYQHSVFDNSNFRVLGGVWMQITGASTTNVGFSTVNYYDTIDARLYYKPGTTADADPAKITTKTGNVVNLQDQTMAVIEQTVARYSTTTTADSGTTYKTYYRLSYQYTPSRYGGSAWGTSTSKTLTAASTTEATTKSTTANILYGKVARNYSVRVYNVDLSAAQRNRNHLADLCGFYGVDVSALLNFTDEEIAGIAEQFATTKLCKNRYNADGTLTDAYADEKLSFEAELSAAIASVLGDASYSYINVYAKEGLVALFDAYGATASSTAVKEWTPVDLYGQEGYDDYIDYEYTDVSGNTAYAYTPTLNGTWKWKDGALHSSYSGASFALSTLGASVGSIYSVQTVYGMTAINGYTRADITTITQDEGDGITTTKNVVNNYTSLSTGAKTLGTMKFGLFSYATLYYAKKQVSANTTLFDAYFCQLKKGNSNTNVFFVGAGAATDNGMRWNTYYYTDADGIEQSFEAYYGGGMPAHVQEMTVSRLGDAVATDSGVAVSYRVHWQFYPTRVSSSPHSSHSTSVTAVGSADSTALTVLAGLEADNYSVRVYNKDLSGAEINRNHFADLVGFYGVNAAPLYRVSDEDIVALAEEYTTVKLVPGTRGMNSYNAMKLELQQKINALGAAAEDSLDTVLSAAIGFDGYSFRVSGDYGIRAIFSVDSSAEERLAAFGYRLLSYGAVTAIGSYNGTQYNVKESLVLTPTEDGGAEMPDSLRGSALVNSRDADFKILDNDGERVSFAYTVTYPTASAAAVLDIQMLYRGYAVLENADGEKEIYYADIAEEKESSSLFLLHKKVVADYAVSYRDTLGYEVYCYLYDALMKVSSDYDTDRRELEWRIIENKPHTVTAGEKSMLDGKKIIFIGDSFIYWGQVVLDSSSSRYNDKGYFYQLCRANGIDVSVTNWTYGGKSISYIYENYMDDLADYNYDYVVLSGGRNSASSAETYFDVLAKYKTLFEAANPDVKFFYNVSSGAHNISVAESFPVEILNNLDEFEKMGFTIVDWGKLVADVIRGETEVPGSSISYNKNSFAVHRSDADGYHPNQLTGYITALMVYSAITGASAEGQPYSFWNDTTLSTRFDADSYIASNYTKGTTNYTEIFASPSNIRGLQVLIDRYLEEKAYRDYNFTNGEEETVNVLFIGNSYTYYNDMPTEIFAALGASAGLSLNVTAITNGGHTLEKYADPNDTYGAKVEAALSGDTHYDYVILQEQSVRPALEDNAAFYAAVRNLTERVRQKGATPILYATWGRESQSETLTTYGWTNESMTWRLAAAYQAIGEELGIEVAFAGLAFYDVYTSESDINLYNADLSHPSYAGSYLAAATLLAKIFGVDTTALTYTGSLSADDAGVLLTAAYSAASAPPAIPEEYQRSSVGQ